MTTLIGGDEESLAAAGDRHRRLLSPPAARVALESGGDPMSLTEMAVARALGWVRPAERLVAVLADGARRPLTHAELIELQAHESGVRG